MEALRTLYFYLSTAIVAAMSLGTLLLTGIVMGFILGRWALLPMGGLVLIVVGAWALRDTVLNSEVES